MRDKITIALSLVALVIGALSLFMGWGRASQVLIITAGMLILAKWIPRLMRPADGTIGAPPAEPSQAINAAGWLGLLL